MKGLVVLCVFGASLASQVGAEPSVMANPYEEIARKQRELAKEKSEAGFLIEALADKIGAPSREISIEDELGRIQSNRTTLNSDHVHQLLNIRNGALDAEPVRIDDNDWGAVTTASLGAEDEIDTIGNQAELDDLKRAPVYLADWFLSRDGIGDLFVQRGDDVRSRLTIRAGMVLGQHGRIMAVRDTPDAFFLVLEDGTRIRGIY